MGSGLSGMGRISTAGGGVGIGSITIEVPPMSLPATTNFIVMETMIPPPVELVDFSPIFVVAPHVSLSVPSKITIRFSNLGSVPRTNLAIYAADDQYSPFNRVDDSKVEGDVVRASVTRFGAFLAGYPKSADQMSCP